MINKCECQSEDDKCIELQSALNRMKHKKKEALIRTEEFNVIYDNKEYNVTIRLKPKGFPK